MENNIAVLMTLNELVMNSTDSNDQSIDNIRIVSNILNQTAILISDHATLSPSNLTVVSIFFKIPVQCHIVYCGIAILLALLILNRSLRLLYKHWTI